MAATRHKHVIQPFLLSGLKVLPCKFAPNCTGAHMQDCKQTEFVSSFTDAPICAPSIAAIFCRRQWIHQTPLRTKWLTSFGSQVHLHWCQSRPAASHARGTSGEHGEMPWMKVIWQRPEFQHLMHMHMDKEEKKGKVENTVPMAHGATGPLRGIARWPRAPPSTSQRKRGATEDWNGRSCGKHGGQRSANTASAVSTV
ncbi:unnamed protein product [Ostreobium quekettii]|uniref:Uncharacterized protein n=1 Tax=Ostreobium quekettii TaxID=121088 RepID=A0A8S1JEW7_9CHLO|nr:unnamed protein product [Ostreobium quekettii]